MASERQNERKPGGFIGRAWMCVFVHRGECQSKCVKECECRASLLQNSHPLKKRSLVDFRFRRLGIHIAMQGMWVEPWSGN